jgi:hypothetical protein
VCVCFFLPLAMIFFYYSLISFIFLIKMKKKWKNKKNLLTQTQIRKDFIVANIVIRKIK